MARRPAIPFELSPREVSTAREIGVLLNEWARTGSRPAMKAAANLGAHLRASCLLADGRSDWRGRGSKWLAIGDVALEDITDPQERKRISGAWGYHINVALREEVSADDLIEAGMDPASPSERQGRRWRLTSEMARAMADPVGGDHDERVLAALEILKSVRLDLLSASSRKPLNAIEKRATKLSANIGELPH